MARIAVVVSITDFERQTKHPEPLVDFLRRPVFQALGKVIDRPAARDREHDL
ncbi:MAG: hypothetical protein JST92_21770 [Deltaproteobacteria bacterium]|nr:hypothetical protein [Deltaproteobacteria bacterium]